MVAPLRSNSGRRPHVKLRLMVATFIGVVFGFFLGASFPSISLSKVHLPPKLFPPIDLAYVEDKYSDMSAQTLLNVFSSFKGHGHSSRLNESTMFAPKNPRGTKTLPPDIVTPESDLYLRRMWGRPNEDLIIKPRYLVTFTVGLDQKDNIDAAVKKMSENFSILLFHYDGLVSEWDGFEWSKSAIHVSIHKQTKWWYAKRFLHPDIVAPYDYIFIWDEDLGVEYFDFEKFIHQIRKHGLEIAQPGLAPGSGFTWEMTRMQEGKEVHKTTQERPGYCSDPHLPPCAGFVEIMAPVFSRNAWRCVWHMLQNDLVHGWGLDFAIRRCVEPAHEKIGVVDSQYIVHQSKPSLGNQGESMDGKAPWEGVRNRCTKEWKMFQDRMADAEKAYFDEMGIKLNNVNQHKWESAALHCIVKMYRCFTLAMKCNIEGNGLEGGDPLESDLHLLLF